MRRSFLPILALVFAAFASLTAWGQGIAVTPEGWQRNVAQTGTVFYRCQAATCAANATVSYRRQPDGPFMTIDQFRRFNEQSNQRMVEGSQGSLRGVEMIELGERRIGDAKLLTAVKLLRRANGTDQYFINTIMVDGGRNTSIVSTADTETAARANMDMFVPVVMLATQMDGGKASGR